MLSYSTLYSAIKTALGNITGVKSVVSEINVFNKAASFPVLMVLGKIVNTEYIMFPQAVKEDREAESEIIVAGSVRPKYKASIESETLALMASVEAAMNVLTTTGIVSINCVAKDYDLDVEGSYGYFEITFNIKYVYNHLLQ